MLDTEAPRMTTTSTTTGSMRAWSVAEPGPIADHPLVLQDRPVPEPGADEVLVRVRACGVCRTDLHLCEGDLRPKRPNVVPGHQVVGVVTAAGPQADRFRVGDRVGVAWLRHTCGRCPACRAGRENLCPRSRYTGWDDDGGFAEYCVVPDAFAYDLPPELDDVHAAPLLCAGIIGYRSLKRANVPPGGRLGIYGFGSSAHLTAQIARAQGCELVVMTRGEGNRALARELGATFVGDATEQPPGLLDAAIIFAPAGDLVPVALRALAPGGTVALAGIHMSQIPAMDYGECLFGERDLRSVTANTRQDGEELLRLAGQLTLTSHTTSYDFDDTSRALDDLAAGRLAGSAVIDLS
jgi:propanol-preferring alcohol dehydrogenase